MLPCPLRLSEEPSTKTTICRIIPQAVCSRYRLRISAFCAPAVLGLMYLFCMNFTSSHTPTMFDCFNYPDPIAWPAAKLLDHILGVTEINQYKKAELRSLLQLHHSSSGSILDEELKILNGVLSLSEKRVVDIMTPIRDVMTLSVDQVLDHETIDKLWVICALKLRTFY